jgi:hypothetical protein
LIPSFFEGIRISSFALISYHPLLKITLTLSAPHLYADLAQSNAVSPIPSTTTCPFNLGVFSIFLSYLTALLTSGKNVFELNIFVYV